MLHHAMGMHGVPRHRHLWSIEDRGLVHVVPDVRVPIGAAVLVQGKLRSPVVSHGRICKVRIQRCPGPAPPFEVRQVRIWVVDLPRLPFALVGGIVDLWRYPGAILLGIPLWRLYSAGIRDLRFLYPVRRLGIGRVVHLFVADFLHKQALVPDLAIHVELLLLLDVRVDHIHKLPSLGGYVVDHLLWVGESRCVPREVGLSIRVLNVQPNGVVRNVVLVIHAVDRRHILLAHVVPTALVLAQGPETGHRRRPGEVVELR
mmetsp:Transcript_5211/g.9298  ORF Transcript_5211/g.9298 Transcript_5211/m.9298 type:complete len:259 (-) Transcript_5211:15-791(-)